MADSAKGVVLKGRFTIRSDEPNETPDLHRVDSKKPIDSLPVPDPIVEEAKQMPHMSLRGMERQIHEVEPHPARLISVSPARTSKPAESLEASHSHRPKKAESHIVEDEQMVGLEVFQSFAAIVSAKFSEMLALHRDIMMEIIHKDANRDEQVLLLCRENAKLARQVTEIEMENQFARERLGS